MIPKALQAHAKKNGMTASEHDERSIGFYRKGGKDLIAFSIKEAHDDPEGLQKQLDKRIAAMKGGK